MISPAIFLPHNPPIILINVPRPIVVPRITHQTPKALVMRIADDTGAEIVRVGEYTYVQSGTASTTTTASSKMKPGRSEKQKRRTGMKIPLPVGITGTLDLDVRIGLGVSVDGVLVGVEGDAASVQVSVGRVDEVKGLATHCELVEIEIKGLVN